MTTEENNTLIANFMEYPGDGTGLYFTPHDSSEKLVSPGELPYHTSWDWIMPVVQKCLDSTPGTNYSKSERFQSYLGVMDFRSIEAIYEAVVQFINWYNTQEK